MPQGRKERTQTREKAVDGDFTAYGLLNRHRDYMSVMQRGGGIAAARVTLSFYGANVQAKYGVNHLLTVLEMFGGFAETATNFFRTD